MGRASQAGSPMLRPSCWPARESMTDEAINAKVAERDRAKKMRNFALADQIRKELTENGIVIEDSKDGVRWKRK